MKYEGLGNLQNTAKIVREILITQLGNQVNELEDGYGIDADVIERLSMKLFVDVDRKVLWKSTKTKFTKAYDKEVNRLIQENIITFEDLGLLLFLATNYTQHEDNYLRDKDGKYITKTELIEDLHEQTKNNSRSSVSYYKKKIIELEKKNLILSESHPKDKRNKVFYLSPQLFYKGKYIDDNVKKSLINITKTIHNNIKKLNEEGKTNVPLDNKFDNKDERELIDQIIEYLNEAC
jgi:DNA-binding MarR family transcriptional regulator